MFVAQCGRARPAHPLEVLQATVDPLDLGITLRAEQVIRAGLGPIKLHVDVPETVVARHLPEVLALLSNLASPVRDVATTVYDSHSRRSDVRVRVATPSCPLAGVSSG